MKFFYLILASVFIMASCKSSSVGTSTDLNVFYSDLYKRAQELKDNSTAITALNALILLDSTETRYKDSLARTYLRSGIFEPGLKLAQEILNEDKDNDGLRELVAEAQGMKGDFDESIVNFSRLYRKNNDIRYVYKMAIAEANKGDMIALNKRLDQILSDSSQVTVDFSDATTGSSQKVNIQAAANMLKAQLAFGQNDIQTGSVYLQKSLQIEPSFKHAQMMQMQLEQYSKQAGSQSAQSSAQDKMARMKAEEQRKLEEFKRRKAAGK